MSRREVVLQRQRRARRRSATWSRECLSHLARILVHCGHSPRDLVIEFQKICRTLKEPSFRFDPTRLSFLADLPHVITLWHSDPGYLADGRVPMALPLLGRGRTLSALIRRVLPEEDPREVTEALLRMQGIRRQGRRYLPTGRHIPYREDTARLYSLSVLMRILRTIERNVSGAWESALFERHAIHPNFPVAALPGFHRQFKRKAADWLWEADGVMRRREKRVRGGKRTRLGVEIFAFEEPLHVHRSSRRRNTLRPDRRARRKR